MDVYHKVLAKLYEVSEGRETVDLDLSDITKQLGYFPSRDQIAAQMMQDGWVTETARKYVVRITHWGVSEAKKTAKNSGKDNDAAKKSATRLVSNVRELLVAAELFADKLSGDELKLVEKHLAEVTALAKNIRSEL